MLTVKTRPKHALASWPASEKSALGSQLQNLAAWLCFTGERIAWLVQPLLVGAAVDGRQQDDHRSALIWLGVTITGLSAFMFRQKVLGAHSLCDKYQLSTLLGIPIVLAQIDWGLAPLGLIALIPAALVYSAHQRSAIAPRRDQEGSRFISLCMMELFAWSLSAVALVHFCTGEAITTGNLIALVWSLTLFRLGLRRLVNAAA